MDRLDIDEALVRSLLREQHPDLAGLELREVPGGWDNQMWRLGEKFAVRMPRTPRAPSLLNNERQWLPLIAPGLPLPVPEPVREGEPSSLFPSTWSVVRWVEGEPADHTPITSPHAASTLAGFLRALHSKAPSDAPANPNRGVPLQALQDDFEHGLDYVFPPEAQDARLPDQAEKFPIATVSSLMAEVRAAWERAAAAPAWADAPVWIHGDLHPANVTVTDGTLSGVLDFGEMCAGDPATDLAACWTLLPAGTAPQFFDVYAKADDAALRRARGWGVLRAIGLIAIGKKWEQGLPGGKQTWGPAGWATLHRVLADNE
jgi:aminoglycoside phosphotransferase (APT) family kinase protein